MLEGKTCNVNAAVVPYKFGVLNLSWAIRWQYLVKSLLHPIQGGCKRSAKRESETGASLHYKIHSIVLRSGLVCLAESCGPCVEMVFKGGVPCLRSVSPGGEVGPFATDLGGTDSLDTFLYAVDWQRGQLQRKRPELDDHTIVEEATFPIPEDTINGNMQVLDTGYMNSGQQPVLVSKIGDEGEVWRSPERKCIDPDLNLTWLKGSQPDVRKSAASPLPRRCRRLERRRSAREGKRVRLSKRMQAEVGQTQSWRFFPL